MTTKLDLVERPKAPTKSSNKSGGLRPPDEATQAGRRPACSLIILGRTRLAFGQSSALESCCPSDSMTKSKLAFGQLA